MAARALLALGLALPAAACSQQNEPGTSVEVGATVSAPWSRSKAMYRGTVKEIYGKLAYIHFEDGDRGWALMTELSPPGTPAPVPDETNQFQRGDRVRAPWSASRTMYDGTVAESYGKLIRVSFDDGDSGWALASESKKL